MNYNIRFWTICLGYRGLNVTFNTFLVISGWCMLMPRTDGMIKYLIALAQFRYQIGGSLMLPNRTIYLTTDHTYRPLQQTNQYLSNLLTYIILGNGATTIHFQAFTLTCQGSIHQHPRLWANCLPLFISLVMTLDNPQSVNFGSFRQNQNKMVFLTERLDIAI